MPTLSLPTYVLTLLPSSGTVSTRDGPDDDRAEHRAPHGAGTTPQRGAADDRGRDGLQFVAAADGGVTGGEEREREQPGERAGQG